MRRICVFAHYDQNNRIDDYVLLYLKRIKEVVTRIIFVSDNNLYTDEVSKIYDVVSQSDILVQKHGEYDFGSYKRGINHIGFNLLFSLYDQLLLCNDSCYGPFFPLNPIFQKMSDTKSDFWGLTQNDHRKRMPLHIQSYFLVFNKCIFLNKSFKAFWDEVGIYKEKDDIVLNYEVKLTTILVNEGFQFKTYFENKHYDLTLRDYSIIIPNGFPFLKKQLINGNRYRLDIYSWDKVIRNVTDYPIRLIFKHLLKNRKKSDYFRILIECIKYKGIFSIYSVQAFIQYLSNLLHLKVIFF